MITIRMYGGYDKMHKALAELGVQYSTRDFMSGFWGKEFRVKKARGRGSSEINRTLYQLADPVDYKRTQWFESPAT